MRSTEWEPDLSSQTGASQAGILLGSNHDIPAFRWVDKPTGRIIACSGPDDCAEIERERATGIGLLDERRLEPRQPPVRRGGRGHPHGQPHLRGEEVEPRLPRVLRERLQRHALARPLLLGDRARGHRGDARHAARRAPARPPRRHLPAAARDDVRRRPRPHRLRRAHGHDARPARDLRDVLELRRGRAPLRARAVATRSRRCASSTSSSAGSRMPAASRRARTRSSCSPTTARRRERRSSSGTATGSTSSSSARSRREACTASKAATSRRRWRPWPSVKRRARRQEKPKKNEVGDRQVVVLGSGNLGLVYLMDEPRRLTLEEIDERHPELLPALREHPHVGWILAALARARSPSRSAGRYALPRAGTRRRRRPARAASRPTAAHHLLRTDGFPHVADLMIGSFYDPDLDEGCAFEELISFHGGLGGPQTRPFILHPVALRAAGRADHRRRAGARGAFGWRRQLQRSRRNRFSNRPQGVSYSAQLDRRRMCGFERRLGRLGGVRRLAHDDHRRARLLPGPDRRDP